MLPFYFQARHQERLATESSQEREAHLHQVATRQEERNSSAEAMLHNFSIQRKIKMFHSHLAALEEVKCSSCLEGFPSVTLASGSTECLRCHTDQKSPKVYSAGNNMNPGPVLSQLQVSCVWGGIG